MISDNSSRKVVDTLKIVQIQLVLHKWHSLDDLLTVVWTYSHIPSPYLCFDLLLYLLTSSIYFQNHSKCSLGFKNLSDRPFCVPHFILKEYGTMLGAF